VNGRVFRRVNIVNIAVIVLLAVAIIILVVVIGDNGGPCIGCHGCSCETRRLLNTARGSGASKGFSVLTGYIISYWNHTRAMRQTVMGVWWPGKS